ncbi:MAG: cation diffusion facilitator family transporter [Verrucomicrobiales bacterium]|nr:cation diffusion facilitator family transporter [Verrucomicrobiales bacterium]
MAENLTQSQRDILADAAARGVKATVWGIFASACLAVVKILAGILGNSYALVADGVESVLDIMSSLMVWGGLRIASQPATERFPYGYGKAEPLAALVVSTVLLGAAVAIAMKSLIEIRTPHHMPEPFTLIVLIGVILTKEMMFRILFRTGENIGSKAMQTDAWHHRSDSLTSIAAFIGISVALCMGPGYESADDWAALFAAGVIGFNGVRLFRSAFRDVLDVSPSPELILRIREIADAVPDVEDTEKCRVRRSGLVLFIDLHVIVDGGLSVREGHDIAHLVKESLMGSELSIQDVTVHIEPTPTPFS